MRDAAAFECRCIYDQDHLGRGFRQSCEIAERVHVWSTRIAFADYFAIDVESWIEPDHRLRGVKMRVDEILRSMRPTFRRRSAIGRPSIPLTMLLKALVLHSLYWIRSEQQLVADIHLNFLYRWFLDLSLLARDATTFTKNRERFQKHGLLRTFFDRVVSARTWTSA